MLKYQEVARNTIFGIEENETSGFISCALRWNLKTKEGLKQLLLLTFGKLHVSNDQILCGSFDTLKVFLRHSTAKVSKPI